MNTLNKIAALLLLSLLSPAFAGQLYQWVGKDGTPTYSPDPPPDGLSYTVVGDNLEPLPEQPATGSVQTVSKKTAPESNTENQLPKKNPVAAVPKWEPVRYANDPTIKQPEEQTGKKTTVASASLDTPVKYVSPECVAMKRDQMILESRFAQAKSDREMDEAILKLGAHTAEQRRVCGN